MNKCFFYFLFVCLVCSCMTLSQKEDRLRNKLTKIDYQHDDYFCEFQNYMNSTETYQILGSESEKWNWFFNNKPDKYDAKQAIYPFPRFDLYPRRDTISTFFYNWLIEQSVVNHWRKDSLFRLKEGEPLGDYAAHVREFKKDTDIFFVGKIRNNTKYDSFLLLIDENKGNKDLMYNLNYLIQVNYQNGLVKSLISVGSYVSVGDITITWTEKMNEEEYVIKFKSIGPGVIYPYNVLKEMEHENQVIEDVIMYCSFKVDKSTGWVMK